MKKTLPLMLQGAGFLVLCVALLCAPWFFAAWEMWWFWTFASLICLSSLLFFAHQLANAVLRRGQAAAVDDSNPRAGGFTRSFPLVAFLIFLAYACVRFLQAEVYMEAERSFFVFFTSFLVALHVVYGLTSRQRQVLFALLLTDLWVLGCYGVANHFITKNLWVMWEPGYSQYTVENRATGSYFCPDHFAGIMEIALCGALSLLLTRGVRGSLRLAAAFLCAVALTGIILSKSRGALLTVIVILAGLLVWGFAQWPRGARWAWRGIVISLSTLGVLLFIHFADTTVSRFKNYFYIPQPEAGPVKIATRWMREEFPVTSRGRMFLGAVRAWKTEPILGIGPGMHQHLWPHFAASEDGDRAKGIWPKFANNMFHSYEVHCDWMQLLEEYGAIGLFLFLLALGALIVRLHAGMRSRVTRHWHRFRTQPFCPPHAMTLTALLAWAAMSFHSFGDFNLQMPATDWILAALAGLGLAAAEESIRDT